METLEEFKILFSSLKDGENRFNYKLDLKFFEAFDFNELNNCEIDVQLILLKTTLLMDLKFELKGSYFVNCDKCLGKLELLMSSNFRQLIKFVEEEKQLENEEVLFIERTAYDINVSPFIFEDCILNFPKKQIHDEGKCDQKNMDILNEYLLIEVENDELDNNESTDPRWEKLKALKKNNNK